MDVTNCWTSSQTEELYRLQSPDDIPSKSSANRLMLSSIEQRSTATTLHRKGNSVKYSIWSALSGHPLRFGSLVKAALLGGLALTTGGLFKSGGAESLVQATLLGSRSLLPLRDSCAYALTAGAAASLVGQHPLPLVAALTTCMPVTNAQQKIGSEFQVNNYTSLSQQDPSVAALPSGNFVVTWESEGQDGSLWGVYGQLFDSSATKIGSEFQVNNYTSSYQREPSVAALCSGNFVVTWASDGQDGDSWGVYGQLFDSNATRASSEFQVNNYTSSSQNFPSAAALPAATLW